MASCSSETNEQPENDSQTPPETEEDNNDETESEIPPEIVKLLKSFSSTNPELSFAQRDFQYEDDFLVRYDYNEVSDIYDYDDLGRLISITGTSITFNYEYNEQNELIQVSRKNNSNSIIDRFTNLNYENNKVTITISQPNSNFENVFVHYLDDQGRIIKIVGDDGPSSFKTKEYSYDDKGNIVTEILKDNESLEDRENNYVYDLDMVNPFFIAYKKLNESNYHISNLLGIDIQTIYGTTPNVVVRENYEYTIDDLKYPSKLIITDENQTLEWLFEY